MNVDTLEYLNQPNDPHIEVCPLQDGQPAPVTISLAELTVLTAELYVPLSAPTTEPLFEQVDLLDFPGYRGRMSIDAFGAKSAESEGGSRLAELILRGKVAYLFERYTENQEMNVWCLHASAKQSDVTDVGDALNEWICPTQVPMPTCAAAVCRG
jgi:hypothetical protein